MTLKRLLEIIPDVQLKPETSDLMDAVICEKVVAARDHKKLKIHIQSQHLLQYSDIKELREAISSQMFDGKVEIEIVQHYKLSSQYTPEILLNLYSSSMIEELKDIHVVLSELFRRSVRTFTGPDQLELKIEHNMIIEMKMAQLTDWLEKMFKERFDMPVTVETAWLPKGKNKAAENAETALMGEISQIVSRYEKTVAEEKQKEALAAQGEAQEKLEKEKKKGEFIKKKLPPDPSLFYGRNFDGEDTPVSAIIGDNEAVVIRGMITDVEVKEIKKNPNKSIVSFAVSDFTDTIGGTLFSANDKLPELLKNVKKGNFVRVKAMAGYDQFTREISLLSITGIKSIPDFTEKRMDNSAMKRVELHCHTTMSDMDGVTECKDLLKTAMRWGHKAMAITDHGVVQAFTDAYHCTEGKDFKVIYGCEGYLVDDTKQIVTDSKGQHLDQPYVVFDIETTGFSASGDKIIEIGAVRIEHGQIVSRFSEFVNPGIPIPFEIEKLTSINDAMVADAPGIEVILPQFITFCDGAVLVAHNADFDTGFIRYNCEQQGMPFDYTYIDTVAIARSLLPDLKNYKLDTVVEAMDCKLAHHHRAVDDAGATADVFVKFLARFKDEGIDDLDAMNAMSQVSASAIKKLKTFHIIILAKNEIGRINLYRLVSMAHLDYYARRPRIPKSQLEKYREGLILGSACEAGELFRAVAENRSEQEIARIADFYDYLEIQPIGNNAFMLRDPKSGVTTEEDLRNLNRKIVQLGEKFDKPVCATCDVHFLNPQDEVYRRLIMYNKGFADADQQPPLYLRTTEEMLAEFDYLGPEKAEEVVITNTNLIADMIDYIAPVRPDKCPPVIENSDTILREICYNRAHELYGEDLPEIVVERLERELNSIIGNGFAVMYIIAQKLVWKSVADGYLVGSRGSVGSSFVAYMAGITEVNSLQAHYLCPNCHYVDFDSDYVKSFTGRSGCDMEDKVCPVCGKPLNKEGHDIPFETFLGFKGNKEPDIDLNFSGDYQSKAHAYTEVIFGKGKTYRAGTVGTLAEKTAYGYAMHYFEEHGISKRSCEIKRISEGCVGVRRTTGQHPGGIIVLPHGEEIYTFTPIQHPANDQTTRIVTTHFDYHSIDHNLLKLDILGHDDPTMIRMLEDITGIDATTIRMDDPGVLSLFKGLDALKITKEDIGGTELGSLGVPEFGTDFAMQMLKDTKPTAFSDLVRIAGLAHGTDVWKGNAETLIKEGKAVISTAICTRDDIMIYLISKGIESEQSFKIMESVRKGKGLTPEWEHLMVEHEVPDWYIWSCKKIKYMFPKAHAVAYVMMGMRIAWFKIYQPLAYYAAFFTIRATSFDYRLMCQGKEAVDRHIREFRAIRKPTAKEKDTIKDLRIVQEFYARGFDFHKIDLYKSDAIKFQIVDGKLLPPFSVIDGMGTIAAEALAQAAQGEPFVSKDDIRQRAKVSSSVVDAMGELGLLGDLPESNQLSIFDVM